MNLKNRVWRNFILSFVLFLLAGSLGSFVVTQASLERYKARTLGDLTKLQEKYTRQHILQVKYLLQSLLQNLSADLEDWAWWDVTLRAAGRRTDREVAEDFSDPSLAHGGVDFLVLYDSGGNPVMARYRPSPAAGSYGAPGADLMDAARQFSGNLRPDGAQGIFLTGEDPLFLGALPVRGNLGEGTPGGVLVLGRYLEPGYMKSVEEALETRFKIVRSETLAPAVSNAFTLSPGLNFYVPPVDPRFLEKDTVIPPTSAYTQVPGDSLRPLILEVTVPPDLLVQERKFYLDHRDELTNQAWLSLVGVLVSNLFLALVYLTQTQRQILGRIGRIDRFALEVAQTPDCPRTLDLEGNDELTNIGRSVQTMVDILEHRNTLVEEKNRQLQSLNRSLFISQEALDASFIPMVITDREGAVTKVNPAFVEVYGYTEAEAAGRDPGFLNPGKTEYWNHGLTEDQYEALFKKLWADIRDPETGRWEGTLFNRTKGGDILPSQVIISAIRIPGEGVLGFIGWTINLSKRHDAERKILVEAFSALSELAEQRDTDTGQHLKRIGLMAGTMARHLGLSRKEVHDIEVCAPLHDIGKVGIRDDILLAPRRLSPEETAVMRTHARIGHGILDKQPTMKVAADIALGHHEWWDGSGYPQGLAGEEVPLAARIVSVVDVYDALRSRRPYKEPWTHREALDLILSRKGTQFDPLLVDLFEAHAGEFMAVADLHGD